MRSEPLKGKRICDCKPTTNHCVLYIKDIRGAVGWLLEEVNAFEESTMVKMTYSDLKTLIKTAFEDVTKG